MYGDEAMRAWDLDGEWEVEDGEGEEMWGIERRRAWRMSVRN